MSKQRKRQRVPEIQFARKGMNVARSEFAARLRERTLERRNALKREIVEIPAWLGPDGQPERFLVRELTGKERALLEQNYARPDGGPDILKMLPDLIIMTTLSPEAPHDQVFDAADRDLINELSGTVLQTLAETTLRLSGLDQNALQQAEKNS